MMRPGRGEHEPCLLVCDGCGRRVQVLDETDVPQDWAASVAGASVRHYCPDCDSDDDIPF